jgi:hypothetical protein
MSEKTVVVAEFDTSMEAHLAVARLEAEAISSFVTGDNGNPAEFSVFGRLSFSAIRLHVDESHVERAMEILAAPLPQPEGNWSAEAESAVEGWICHLCDTPVEESSPVCTACGEPRRAKKKKKKRQ